MNAFLLNMNAFLLKPWVRSTSEVFLLVALFFAVSGVAPPAVNEAHYFAKSKNYWDPNWCNRDLFASSGNPHLLFHLTFGALTNWFSLATSAWIGRLIGWAMIAIGLRMLTATLTKQPLASLAVAVIWIGFTAGFNLAGEWVIGGIEGKVPAYGLMLVAMRLMLDGKWRFVWPVLGLASGFHVLVGGWSVLVAIGVYLVYGRTLEKLQSQIVPLLIGGAISMSGIYPALMLTRGVDATIVTAAAKIYAYERLPHHLLPTGLEWHWYLRHAVLLTLTAVACWRLRADKSFAIIRSFTIGMVLIAVVGLLIGIMPAFAPDLAAKLLRFYWFRMTDAVVPLTLALAWVRLPLVEHVSHAVFTIRVAVMVVALLIVSGEAIEATRMTVITDSGFVASAIGMNTAPGDRQRVVSDWIEVCHWVDRTLPQDEILLTPRNQQTFKWYANRAEVVNWKDVPQDAERLVQWSQRFYGVFPVRLGTVRVTVRYPDLIRYREEYGARFMVVDRRYSGQSLPLVQVYPLAPSEANTTYAVYRLP